VAAYKILNKYEESYKHASLYLHSCNFDGGLMHHTLQVLEYAYDIYNKTDINLSLDLIIFGAVFKNIHCIYNSNEYLSGEKQNIAIVSDILQNSLTEYAIINKLTLKEKQELDEVYNQCIYMICDEPDDFKLREYLIVDRADELSCFLNKTTNIEIFEDLYKANQLLVRD
jgi:hypothetical protein